MTAVAETRKAAFDHIDIVIRDLESDRELDHGLFATWDQSGAEEWKVRRVDHFNHRSN